MTPESLREFGNHVREARVRRGWTLEILAGEAFGNPDRKGYLSQVENGKRPLSALTIGNLARVLNLPAEVTRPLLFAPAAQDEVTREDQLAETLIHRADTDTSPPQTEALVIALAYEFAGGKLLDLHTAYTGLRSALQAAADMRAQLSRLDNIDDRLSAVLTRVADLNDLGLRDEAAEALEDAIKLKEAELDSLHKAALKQDRLRNDPVTAAKRLIARLHASAPPQGMFIALQSLLIEIRDRGDRQGDQFDLSVAFELAKVNRDRAKGPKLAIALSDLGNTLRMLGERTADLAVLNQAIEAHRAALTFLTPEDESLDWAASQNNLGNALYRLAERTADPTMLQRAIDAHRAALTVYTSESTPKDWAQSQKVLGISLQALGVHAADPAMLQQAIDAQRAALLVYSPLDTPRDWAKAQNNLGVALRWMGAVSGDATLMEDAASAYASCLKKESRDTTAFLWAQSHWNLADLAYARHVLSNDAIHLDTARYHLALALEVFTAEGSDYQLAECDRLQTLIDRA